MKKMNKINSLILLLVLLCNILFPVVSMATDGVEELIEITFNDENLYNTIIEELSDKIESSDVEELTIEMTQENIDSITSLKLKDITNIEGIENFTNLNYFYISNYGGENYENDIDLTPLSNMVKLKTLIVNYVTIKDISMLKNISDLTKLELHRTAGNSAPISENGFKDITVLKNMQNLNSLSIRGYDIGNNSENSETLSELYNLKMLKCLGCNISDNDLTYISKLEDLETLYLGYVNYEGNNVTDITPLSKLINLKELYLCNNNIEDLKPLENLTNLRELYLDQNKVSNVEPIANLTNLVSLSFGRELYGKGNPLKDITPLSNLKNLTELRLSNCDIDDITCLDSLTNLTRLDISGNNIKGINILKKLNLKYLYLSKNNIDDATILDNELSQVKSLWSSIISNNSITVEINKENTDENLVELPTIFLQAKDQNSRLYTEKDYILVNCTLSSDEKSVIIDDGAEEASVKISGGEATGTILSILLIDETPPELDVQYSTKEITKDTVTVTIKANEKIQQVEGWTLSEDGMSLSKVYAKNTTETVKVYDLAENDSIANISINNIDITSPQAEINYSTTKLTNQNVTVTIIANEKIKSVDGWILSSDKTTLTKLYEDNKEENITIYDLAGNYRNLTIAVNNIDKNPPKTEISYSTTELTNGNVEVTITANEEIKEIEGWIISSDRKTLIKEYKNNVDKERIIISDLAENTQENEITITNIDKEAPELYITYSIVEETTENVVVKIKANEKIQQVEGWSLDEETNTLIKEFSHNTDDEIIIYDLAGNGTVQQVIIDNIVNKTTAPSIPQTGENVLIIIGIISVLSLAIVLGIRFRSFKDIK